MWHRVRAAGNRSMGGPLILLPPQGWLIVRSRLEDPWFWKAHESERYVECAIDTTLRRYPPYILRRSVLETAAAARRVNDRACCNLGITRQLFRSIGIGGHSTILLGGGLVCPGDWFCHNVLLPIIASATEVEHTYDDLYAWIAGRKERAVDDNEKGRRVGLYIYYWKRAE